MLGLGIDTGGTFTDAVIVDLDTKNIIAKAKSPTTYQDLSIGILGAIDKVINNKNFRIEDVGLVGLSTTLATNSILQGKGGRVALIGIGWKPQPEWVLGCDTMLFVKGGYDSLGRLAEELDAEAVEMHLEEVCAGMDAIAISGLFSVSNPLQEQNVAEIVKKKCDLPLVLGHALTGDLGVKERTVTAVMNAKLLPIMRDFIASVEKALKLRRINARILIFKGDGGLMTAETAMERPIETTLSGPAASLIGGSILAGEGTCIVVDVGGTSTDIAILEDGFPVLSDEGSVVGGLRTRIKAIDAMTCGLGGDSLLWLDKSGELRIGPERAVPLAMASMMKPGFSRRVKESGNLCYYVPGRSDIGGLREGERLVQSFVSKNAPCSYYEVMDGVPEVVLTNDALEGLRRGGYILRTGLTATDVMHVQGLFSEWDREASVSGLEVFAEKLDMSPSSLAEKVMIRFVTRVGEEIIKKLVADELGSLPVSTSLEKMLYSVVGEKTMSRLGFRTKIDRPLIGIGAPAKILIDPLKVRIDTKVLIPDGYDVGNAVGAVCSRISEHIHVQVSLIDDTYYLMSQFASPSKFKHVEEALSSAKSLAERYVRDKVEASGAYDIRVKLDVKEKLFCDGYGKDMKFMNFVDVWATATGIPKL